jgi:hypothetical protein
MRVVEEDDERPRKSGKKPVKKKKKSSFTAELTKVDRRSLKKVRYGYALIISPH